MRVRGCLAGTWPAACSSSTSLYCHPDLEPSKQPTLMPPLPAWRSLQGFSGHLRSPARGAGTGAGWERWSGIRWEKDAHVAPGLSQQLLLG